MRGAQPLSKCIIWGIPGHPDYPANDRCKPKQMWGTSEPPLEGTLSLQGGEEVRDIQHDFMDIIPASMQIHVTREDCLLVIGIKGDSSRIRQFIEKLSSLVKAKQVLVSLTPV